MVLLIIIVSPKYYHYYLYTFFNACTYIDSKNKNYVKKIKESDLKIFNVTIRL